jgi:hypothetical protein
MADVEILVAGLPDVTPLGITLTYGVNTLPVCLVSIDPSISNDASTSTLIQDPDAYKRKGDILVDVSVTYPDSQTTETITFLGLFDGLSIDMSFGSMTVNAVIKSKFQQLLECYTKIPGLNAMGLNPFQRVSCFSIDSTGDLNTAFKNLFVSNGYGVPTDGQNVLQYYLSLAKFALGVQTGQGGDLASIIGTAQNQDITNLLNLLEHPGFQAGATKGLSLLNSSLNLDAVAGLPSNLLAAGNFAIGNNCIDSYLNNSEILWENMVQFYNTCGCNLIASQSTIYIAPNNGFLNITPATTGGPNVAIPSQYNHFSYNDNGYRDIGYVAVLAECSFSGQDLIGNMKSYGGYPANGQISLSPSSGLVVVKNHPLLFLDDQSLTVPDHFNDKQESLAGGEANYSKPQTYASGATAPVASMQDVSTSVNTGTDGSGGLQKYGDNYAEIKFYQLRYGDRTGQIIMQFNNNWVPGTCGALYIKKLSIWMFFYIELVTHTIRMDAPSSGTAITVINFSCARIGTKPAGVDKDTLFNYDSTKMTTLVNSFIGDNK